MQQLSAVFAAAGAHAEAGRRKVAQRNGESR